MTQPLQFQTMQLNPDPEVIDLGVGQPQVELLPLALVRRAAAARLEQDDRTLLQYGAEQGDGYFRFALAEFLTREYGLPVDPGSLFVTSGASQALDLLATLLARTGDTVLVEEPSYFLALSILRDHRLHVVGVPADNHGIEPVALEEEIKRHRPAFVYVIPAYQNPTGVTLSLERRERLVELSEAYDLPVVADEVYQLLWFNAPPPPPLGARLDRGNVISLGSFSKILAPGLRLGWVQARRPVIDRLTYSGLLDSGGGLNPFTSGLLRVALEEGWQEEYLAGLRATYRARAAAMSAALHRELGSLAHFLEPEGGYFFWLGLPESFDAADLVRETDREKVGLRAGTKFSSRGGLRNYIRLCFAFYDIPVLEEGVARLARAIRTFARDNHL